MNGADLDLLVHRYFERTLSPEEEEGLWALIRSSPAAADRFVELAELESALAETLKAERELPSGVHRILRKSRRTVRTAAPQFPWAVASAAGILAVVALFFVLRFGDASPKPNGPAPVRASGSDGPTARPSVADVPRRESPGAVTETPRANEEPGGPLPIVRPPDAPAEKPAAPGGPSRPSPEPEPKKLAPANPNDVPEKPTLAAPKAPEAVVVRAEGEVLRVGDAAGARVQAGQAIPAEQGMETRGAKGAAALRLPDGTILELRGDTRVEKVLSGGDPQRSVILTRGTVMATVAKQAEGRTLAFRTPHAEAAVLGTKFLLQLAADSTRVDVEEGRVRLRRLSDGLAADISAGHFAQAGKGIPPVARPIPIVRSFQDGVSPTPDYAGTRDASISSASPSSNSGGADQLRIYRGAETQAAALVKWDLTSIPAKSKILSAEVSFWVTGSLAGGIGRVYDVRRPWEESEATWKLAGTGRPWQVAGAQGEGDRGPKALATLAPTQNGMTAVLLNEAGLALVQQWVASPQSNQGLAILKEPPDAWDLSSRKWANPEHRPKLTVTYVPLGK